MTHIDSGPLSLGRSNSSEYSDNCKIVAALVSGASFVSATS